MSTLKDSLIQSLEAAQKEGALNQTKNEIRSMITRLYPDKKTLDRVNDIYSTRTIVAPSTNTGSYKVYTPDFGIKKKSKRRAKQVVADKEGMKIKEASDDLSVEQIIDHIKADTIEKEYGSIEAFRQYTEERFGLDYGRKTAKASVLNHFLERIEGEEEEQEETQNDNENPDEDLSLDYAELNEDDIFTD